VISIQIAFISRYKLIIIKTYYNSWRDPANYSTIIDFYLLKAITEPKRKRYYYMITLGANKFRPMTERVRTCVRI